MPERTEYREASVHVRVMEPPTVNRLYFWALQATFVDKGGKTGGAHLGLQWNPRFPENRAANWGGYDGSGQLLWGTESNLPSTPNDPNSRDYPWVPGRKYRLGISRGDSGWLGQITDMAVGESVAVRELIAEGDLLTGLMVWSEVFADCDDRSVTVGWSHFKAIDAFGDVHRPNGLRVNYQAFSRGGCSNTDVVSEAGEVVQVTNAMRTLAQGSVIELAYP